MRMSHSKKRFKSVLVSFATAAYRNSQLAIADSALIVGGISRVDMWNPERLKETDFYQQYSSLLDQQRGAGYWVWKPYIILRALNEASDQEFVVYWDCRENCQFKQNITPLLQWCEEHNDGILPGAYIPFWGKNKLWTKRDAFVYMGCDSAKFWNHCQVQASFSVWQKNEKSVSFLEKWLYYCVDSKIVSDMPNTSGLPNFPQFIDHRHDQSVLTNLVIKEGIKSFGPIIAYFSVDREKSKDINFMISWSSMSKIGHIENIALGLINRLIRLLKIN